MLRRHRRRRLRAWPLLHLVPNMFTILSLCLGLTALRYGLDGRFEVAVAFVMLAAVADGLDGRSARLLNVTSRLGAELDSLADFVNFGVIPALLVYLWTLEGFRGVGWPVTIAFATCCALRLARFNSELDNPDRPKWTFYFFTGIPAPAAAGLALMPMMLWFVTRDAWPRLPALNAAMLIFVAIMMVSRVPTFSLKRVRIAPDHVLPVLAAAGIALVFLVTETWLTLSVLGLIYLASIPVSWVMAGRLRRRELALAAPPSHAAGAEVSEPAPGGASAVDPAEAGAGASARVQESLEAPARPDGRIVSFEGRAPRG